MLVSSVLQGLGRNFYLCACMPNIIRYSSLIELAQEF